MEKYDAAVTQDAATSFERQSVDGRNRGLSERLVIKHTSIFPKKEASTALTLKHRSSAMSKPTGERQPHPAGPGILIPPQEHRQCPAATVPARPRAPTCASGGSSGDEAAAPGAAPGREGGEARGP